MITASFSNDDDNGNENVKKNNRFIEQNNKFARASPFCVHFLLHDYEVKMCTFYGGRKQAKSKFSFSFKLDSGPQEINSREICGLH